jgi:hypothetical protein
MATPHADFQDFSCSDGSGDPNTRFEVEVHVAPVGVVRGVCGGARGAADCILRTLATCAEPQDAQCTRRCWRVPEVTATRCRVKWCRRTRFQPGAAPCATPASVPRCDSVTSNSPWCAGATPLWCARNPPFPDTPCTCASISSCHPPGATRCHLHGWPTCGLKMIGSLHTVRRDAVCLAVNCVWAHARLVRFGDQAFRALDDWLLMDRETVVSSAVLGRLGSVARRDAQVATSAAVGGVVYISPAAPCWCSFDEGSVPGTPPAADRSISPWGVRGFKLRLLRNSRREGTIQQAGLLGALPSDLPALPPQPCVVS